MWVLIAMHAAAVAEEDKQDTVQVHGKSLTLSCAEWKRNQDGSWINTGPLLVGTDTVTSVTLRGAKETQALETKCANGSKSSRRARAKRRCNEAREAQASPCTASRWDVETRASLRAWPVATGHADGELSEAPLSGFCHTALFKERR